MSMKLRGVAESEKLDPFKRLTPMTAPLFDGAIISGSIGEGELRTLQDCVTEDLGSVDGVSMVRLEVEEWAVLSAAASSSSSSSSAKRPRQDDVSR